MINIKDILRIVVLTVLIILVSGKISDKRRCFDENCSEVVSFGVALITYHSKDPDLLSFHINSEVKIYSKDAGSRPDVWGVEINNKRGYIPKRFIRETKVVHKELNHIVPTESIYNLEEHLVNNAKPQSPRDNANFIENNDKEKHEETSSEKLELVDPIRVTPTYESYDGTILPNFIELENFSTVTTQTLQSGISNEQDDSSSYPSIISSTISMVSDILRGPSDDSEENNSIPASSKSNVNSENVMSNSSDLKKTDSPNPNTENNVLSNNEVDNINDDSHKKSSSESLEEDTEKEGQKDNLLITPPPTIDPQPPVQESQEQIEEENFFQTPDEVSDNYESINVANNQIADEVPLNKLYNDVEAVQSSSQLEPSVEEQPASVNNINNSNLDHPSINDSPSNNQVNDIESVPLNQENSSHEIFENISINDNDTFSNDPSNIVTINNTEESFTEDSNVLEAIEGKEQTDDLISSRESDIQIEVLPANKMVINNLVDSENQSDEKSYLNPINTLESHQTPTPISPQDNSQVFENLDTSNSRSILNDKNKFLETEMPSLLQLNSEISPPSKPDEVVPILPVKETLETVPSNSVQDGFSENDSTSLPNKENHEVSMKNENKPMESSQLNIDKSIDIESPILISNYGSQKIENTCEQENSCPGHITPDIPVDANAVTDVRKVSDSPDTLIYVIITATTTLLFSLGYYFIENKRRDAFLIAKINKLQSELMTSKKECIMLEENLNGSKSEVDGKESVSSEEYIALKNDLLISEQARSELEENNAALVKELESAESAMMETRRLMHDSISSHTAALAELEEMQKHLKSKQMENESLSKVINGKKAENEHLNTKFKNLTSKYEALENVNKKLSEEINELKMIKSQMEVSLIDQLQRLENQIKAINEEKRNLAKQLKQKELNYEQLSATVNQLNSGEVDVHKLFEVSRIRAESIYVTQERDELHKKLGELQAAHKVLEEHIKSMSEAASDLSKQCDVIEKEKKEAEARLEVLEEKELQRQKEETIMLEKQGEVATTIEKLQLMAKDIDHYKQQIGVLKREIMAQETYYKEQIKVLETKAHEQWILARNHERRLQESKAESNQLRNKLTMLEKNSLDGDAEAKMHRVATNGESGPSPTPFLDKDSSGSPINFGSSLNAPLPPPFWNNPGLPPGFIPPPPLLPGMPPHDRVQRLPPVGGRLSSPPPPPIPLVPLPILPNSKRFDKLGTPPPALSPPIQFIPFENLPPYMVPPPHDLLNMPPIPPPISMPGSHNTWGDDTLQSRNTPPHPHQRDQRTRNRQDSLRSSRESLNKSQYNENV